MTNFNTGEPNLSPDRRKTLIHVDQFTKSYSGHVAVSDMSFSVQAGQVLGVIGPNGAGKTTTMRAVSALIAPTAGTLQVAGIDVVADPIAVKRQLAYIPDEPQLFPQLTVNEHLAFSAAAYGVENAEEKASALLQDFELTDKRHTAAKDLSRGMKQKLAICCSCLYDPVAILFDEPLTGLDPRGIRRLKQMIGERAAHGAAVLISSHLLAMVEDICTHILMIDGGQPKFFGTLKELRQKFAADSTLENIFFMATESPEQSAAPVLATH